MPFGEWYCVVCQKSLQLGTVAPRTAMNRHLDSARHRKLAAKMQAVNYPKLEPKHGETYERVEALKRSGVPACDAVDHNAQDEYGCSNPTCWKHAKPRPETKS